MLGWQEPKNGKRIYIVKDNSPMMEFYTHIPEEDRKDIYISYEGKSRINLGIHEYKGKLYSSNFVGICRLKKADRITTIMDSLGNEILINVIPRFKSTGVVDLLNYIRDDEEFDRYLAPQTTRTKSREKDIEAVDKNEIFYFFENEKPLKISDSISNNNSIITVTVFLNLLRALCKKPLMGKMQKEEANFTGKVKGKIAIEKNIQINTIHGRKDRFYCQYLKYTDDIIENQILKAALKKAKRYILDYFGIYVKDNNTYSAAISYCSNALKHISDINCKGADCNKYKFTGCYAYYKPVMLMAQMVLDGISIESNGTAKTSGYVVPYAISMEKLFEVYVRAYLKKNGFLSYNDKKPEGIRIEKYDDKKDVLINDSSVSNPGRYISGTVKPDIVLRDTMTNKVVILDVKYKDFNNSSNAREDRLQLLAYSLMYNSDDIGLIFPIEDVEIEFGKRDINSAEARLIKYHQYAFNLTNPDGKIAQRIEETFS